MVHATLWESLEFPLKTEWNTIPHNWARLRVFSWHVSENISEYMFILQGVPPNMTVQRIYQNICLFDRVSHEKWQFRDGLKIIYDLWKDFFDIYLSTLTCIIFETLITKLYLQISQKSKQQIEEKYFNIFFIQTFLYFRFSLLHW